MGTRLGPAKILVQGDKISRTKIGVTGPARGTPRQHCVRRNSGRLECSHMVCLSRAASRPKDEIIHRRAPYEVSLERCITDRLVSMEAEKPYS